MLCRWCFRRLDLIKRLLSCLNASIRCRFSPDLHLLNVWTYLKYLVFAKSHMRRMTMLYMNAIVTCLPIDLVPNNLFHFLLYYKEMFSTANIIYILIYHLESVYSSREGLCIILPDHSWTRAPIVRYWNSFGKHYLKGVRIIKYICECI